MWSFVMVKLLILISCRNLVVSSQRSDISPDLDSQQTTSKTPQQRRFGLVSSPFFFLCHSPRPGEPTDVGLNDVTLRLNVTGGGIPFEGGYEPQTVYELLISSNVKLDGFLLTGVHAITKEFMKSNHLHLTPSVSSQNSAGAICSFLHSHISKKPRSKISLMWRSPPKGTGCVAFLATGSLQEKLLFKDLLIKEVCEKEEKLGSIKARKSVLISRNESGFVFKDDFENFGLDNSIWDETKNGGVKNNPFRRDPGLSLVFNGSSSYVQTLPMDFSSAKHYQFTLGPGGCDRGGTVRVYFGSVSPLPKLIQSSPYYSQEARISRARMAVEEVSSGNSDLLQGSPVSSRMLSNFGEFKEYDINTNEVPILGSGDHEDVNYIPEIPNENRELNSQILPAKMEEENVDEGSGSGSQDDAIESEHFKLFDTMQSDDGTFRFCSHWTEIDFHEVPPFQEVHTRAIPNQFQKTGICIKWEMKSFEDKDEKQDSCWSLDNVAVTTTESKEGPIVDDFDPIDPTNWLFFPGGKVQESCGSEGNSLWFEGLQGESWASTRLVDLSGGNFEGDDVIRKIFSNAEDDEWAIKGGDMTSCERHESTLTFHKNEKREACSPFFDGRSFGVIKIVGGINVCATSNKVNLTLSFEINGIRKNIKEIYFQTRNEVLTLPMTSHLQREGIRICIEQPISTNEFSWNLKEVSLLPWMPSKPQYFFQAQMNMKCEYSESKIDIESSNDGGSSWSSLHSRCIPGQCEGESFSLTPMIANGIDSGWTLVTLPLPYIALTPHTKIRIRELENGNSIWRPKWAIDYIYIGKCPQGCNGHGLCTAEEKCKCEYGYVGDACEISERPNPVYISEPFMSNIDNSANILEVSGGETSYQCGIIGSGLAAVFKGRNLRYLTTIDLDTSEAHILQFHFRAGTISNVGKCPGPDEDTEGVYIHYSCSGGVTWHLLKTLHPSDYNEPSHISIILPPAARNPSCRFQIWQPEHSGPGRDMWAIDDLTVTSQRFNTIELTFDDAQEANNSLRFHLGEIEDSCGRNETMVFSGSSNDGLVRFLETKSVGIGPSYMMQFDLVIGCDSPSFAEENSTVVLEYSLNHGLTWKLVQRPCTPSTPGCQSHFTRGTVYHISEFQNWKRTTLRLPKHTWSPTTRLRLRQLETSDIGLPWSVDNIYIGHQCNGLCSGHGYCTTRGCRCDSEFHGHKCLPLHKLFKEIDADFDQDDHIKLYSFQVIGGTLAARFEGCGAVVSGNSLYFGIEGIRHFETDDINAEELHSIMFNLVIGGDHGLQRSCQSSREGRSSKEDEEEEEVSYGSVVLEYSTDGGLSWDLLKEMIRSEYRKPKQFHMIFEDKVLRKAKESSGVIRFRLWQPKHNAEDQWALDNFIVKPSVETNSVQADFRENAVIISPWLSSTKYSQKKYCHSEDFAQVMDSEDPIRLAVTDRLTLNEGDIISFQISVGCKDVPNDDNLVKLEFSRDGGNSWELLDKGCLPSSIDCSAPREPSMYSPGHHGPWKRVLLPVDHRLTHGDTQLRWIQENPGETKGGEFALRDLYIGPPCKHSCMGHGMCNAEGLCKCDKGFSGKYCGLSETKKLGWLRDGFETQDKINDFWDNVDGAVVSAGCDPDHIGNVMFFSGDGHRFITTRELDTRNVKYLAFDLQIGANNYESRCQRGISPRDNVMVEYSNDNGLSWNLLQEFEPTQTVNRNQPFFIPLPSGARTKQTKFRWWQSPLPLFYKVEGTQAEWQLDNAMILANDTLPLNIVEDFSTDLSDDWFMIKGGQIRSGCGKKDKSLIFSGHLPMRYAETWDFEVNEATIVQFDIKPGCESLKTPTDVRVEYSTNNGKTWNLVKEECYPPNTKCETHDLPSIYSSKSMSNWSRITLNLPSNLEGERTRLIFRQQKEEREVVDPASSWAIDNIFIGDACPWLCSGQGRCQKDKCTCDEGFFGEFCVPAKVLPCELLDKFNKEEINDTIWRDVQGAEISNRCATLVSKSALVFFKNGPRYATTTDLDMTGGQFLQFNLLMGCQNNMLTKSRSKRKTDEPKPTGMIFVQYSTNGGIYWTDLKNIQFLPHNDVAFISIELSDFPESRSNATRFRFWQPTYHDSLENIWAIDNLFIGGAPVNPNVLFEDFNSNIPSPDAWIDFPAGYMKPMCGSYEARSAIVFGSEDGEHAAYTKDLSVDKFSVVQFDIKVGCGNLTTDSHNVSFEYSTDFGLTWTPLILVQPLFEKSPDYLHELQTPTIYYPNAARGWTRITIPLNDINICGNVRFRWWQGYYHSKQTSEDWALDNIYIGPRCPLHCTGHGYCINGDSCDCDEKYDDGIYCHNVIQNDQQLLQDFDDERVRLNFDRWSGADISNQCDVLSGKSLLFWQQGERMLITKDLDLVHGSVVQFYLRFACYDPYYQPSNKEEPIIMQYSTNGGIHWHLLSKLSEESSAMEELPNTRQFTISLPESSKTNSTRLRWWQPSQDGIFHTQWAVDQIYIGSTALALPYFYDDGSGKEWLLRPGSMVEKACGFSTSGINYAKNNGVRFAETPDIITKRKSFIQFEISIGCKETNHCFDVLLEYSIDHGKSWHLVKEECHPHDPDCPEYWSSSIMTSDLFTALTQVTLSLPSRARSRLARFRFSQKTPWDFQHSWFVSRVYIGDSCGQRCTGRGFCEGGKCNCQQGWKGEQCEVLATSFPKYIADDFTSTFKKSMWKRIVGAKVSELCGPIASGPALHFYGSCSRLLETVDVDLRQALFVQFDLYTGCLHPVSNESASGDNSILVQISCNAGITWRTLKRLPLLYHKSTYVWIEIPTSQRCLGARVRWWQPGKGPRSNLYDWALDSVIVGGKSEPPSAVSLITPDDLSFPLWLRGYNTKPGTYCYINDSVQVLESTPSEAAIVQTTDIQITPRHSIHFRIALGCGAAWDNSIEPVSLQFSRDFGRSWNLVRELCLPFNSTTCTDLHDESVFYAPQEWLYYVFPLEHIGSSKYTRFRWIQNATADVMGNHKWALRDVYIGLSCQYHCLGRGSCVNGKCICDKEYGGEYCENIIITNVPYIKDSFNDPEFLDHWKHIQGALLAPGCGEELEEPPAATFQGPHTRALMSRPVDTRSARFVLFTAQIGSLFGRGLCRPSTERIHNVYLQYSIDGGIKWYLLRELDHQIYRRPKEDYIVIPRHAMTPATVFRFWQPRLVPPSPAWSLDNVFIGGSEIGASQLLESFDGEPTVSEWLFAPHSQTEQNYCEKGDNGSLVWEADHPGHRAITTQELLVQDGHVLQFKISVGCQQVKTECYKGPQVNLEFTTEGGATGWDLVRDSCLPDTSPDPDCFPYMFHGPSTFTPDVYSSWTRVTIPLPEKTWSSTTQLRWVQEAGRGGGQVERILPWALDDVYVGRPCQMHCRGHGDCVQGNCVCDHGYEGVTCEPHPSFKGPLPTSLIDGFEGGFGTNWATVTGGNIGLGCNSLAPYGHGKHLYFNGCGTRQAITYDLDTRRASKVMFVLRIGSHDNMRSCRVDLTDPKRAGNKGVVFQYSSDNGITWTTIDVHNPLDFRKARRVAYSLPKDARLNGVQLRWWQPEQDGLGADQWALDNVEIILAQRKPTHQFETQVYHQDDL